ncbi:MAG: hypothetical protein WC777_05850 [Candidatus Gracilibacteria bacterium]|jgi:hypothetical protein
MRAQTNPDHPEYSQSENSKGEPPKAEEFQFVDEGESRDSEGPDLDGETDDVIEESLAFNIDNYSASIKSALGANPEGAREELEDLYMRLATEITELNKRGHQGASIEFGDITISVEWPQRFETIRKGDYRGDHTQSTDRVRVSFRTAKKEGERVVPTGIEGPRYIRFTSFGQGGMSADRVGLTELARWIQEKGGGRCTVKAWGQKEK